MFHRHLTTSPNKMKSANVMLKAIFFYRFNRTEKTEEMMIKQFLTLVKHNFLITQSFEETKMQNWQRLFRFNKTIEIKLL